LEIKRIGLTVNHFYVLKIKTIQYDVVKS